MAAKSMPSDLCVAMHDSLPRPLVGVPVSYLWLLTYPPNCYSTVEEER